MQESPRDPHLYVQNVLAAVERIEKYLRGMKYKEFTQSPLTIDAVSYNIVVIGETVRNMPPNLPQSFSRLFQEKIVSISEKIVYEYFNITHKWLWRVIQDDISNLKRFIQEEVA